MKENDSEYILKQKRKWQIALRRYILQGYGSYIYAPYFGIDALNFRKWIEIQLGESIDWGNFPSKWQFDHIIPLSYFDLTNEKELKLCWNFTNIRLVAEDSSVLKRRKIDLITAKSYYNNLQSKTKYTICKLMLEKIEQLESLMLTDINDIENYLIENQAYLENLQNFSIEEYSDLNKGKPYKDIVMEQFLLKKFK